ncbi:glycosyltransferase [Candidatus Woesearchaeota archaeon]|nr:MAG: glycosyltransferase [Candidatus Woesearchaeota archaeon]
MLSIVITAFKEPKTIGRAMDAILTQDIDEEYELIVACPDKETRDIVLDYSKKYKWVKHFHDPGKGKSYALNLLFKELTGDYWLFTDGDVYLGDGAVNHMLKYLRDKNVGCVCGHVLSSSPRSTKLGYWSHLLAYGAHLARKERFESNNFLECSGYLFGFKNGLIKKIPLDVAEDSIIPYMIWKKGYSIAYAKDAYVYVKNPEHFSDWLKQRKRTAGAHSKLTYYAPEFPKMKSFKNEALKGLKWVWSYPKNFKEFVWTLELFPARLLMWVMLYYEEKIKGKSYNDGWERVESTK